MKIFFSVLMLVSVTLTGAEVFADCSKADMIKKMKSAQRQCMQTRINPYKGKNAFQLCMNEKRLKIMHERKKCESK